MSWKRKQLFSAEKGGKGARATVVLQVQILCGFMSKLLLMGLAHELLPVGSHSRAAVIPLRPCCIPTGKGQRAAEASGGAVWGHPSWEPSGQMCSVDALQAGQTFVCV